MGIRIVDHKVLRALMQVPYHPKLIALTLWYAWRSNCPVITSGYRKGGTVKGESGVHNAIPCRAIDWRSHDLLDPQHCVDDINDHWEYDPKRPHLKCAIYHDVGQGAHIHTQVHDRTVYHPNGRPTLTEEV